MDDTQPLIDPAVLIYRLLDEVTEQVVLLETQRDHERRRAERAQAVVVAAQRYEQWMHRLESTKADMMLHAGATVRCEDACCGDILREALAAYNDAKEGQG